MKTRTSLLLLLFIGAPINWSIIFSLPTNIKGRLRLFPFHVDIFFFHICIPDVVQKMHFYAIFVHVQIIRRQPSRRNVQCTNKWPQVDIHRGCPWTSSVMQLILRDDQMKKSHISPPFNPETFLTSEWNVCQKIKMIFLFVCSREPFSILLQFHRKTISNTANKENHEIKQNAQIFMSCLFEDSFQKSTKLTSS